MVLIITQNKNFNKNNRILQEFLLFSMKIFNNNNNDNDKLLLLFVNSNNIIYKL